ncbi:hypothetical protein CEXT_336481 [Caerostris extrusa]|uniref:Uncharacterized protein n=1 Tax=Caerostris extrusa TaxID=172846 RepID=A0AAV4UG94_CAEEX|nr:hypothetical protein CEXT_336481 [Caerostris extrusa]
MIVNSLPTDSLFSSPEQCPVIGGCPSYCTLRLNRRAASSVQLHAPCLPRPSCVTTPAFSRTATDLAPCAIVLCHCSIKRWRIS